MIFASIPSFFYPDDLVPYFTFDLILNYYIKLIPFNIY